MDDKGTVKGVKAGEAKIKAVAQDGSNVESGISTVKVTEKKINRGDTKTLLKDKNGNQLYCKDGDTYREATTADYYTKDKFYRKKRMWNIGIPDGRRSTEDAFSMTKRDRRYRRTGDPGREIHVQWGRQLKYGNCDGN